MLVECTFQNRPYRLVSRSEVRGDRNVFTLIIGKNGMGKSRFLRSIVVDRIKHEPNARKDRQTDLWEGSYFHAEYRGQPSVVIAVSTSPFDRFPVFRSKTKIHGYTYLGIRDMFSINLGLSYMSRVVSSLIEVLIKYPDRMLGISRILEELGFTSNISIRFNSRISSGFIRNVMLAENIDAQVSSLFGRTPAFFSINRSYFENEDGSLSKQKFSRLKKALERIQTSKELNQGYSVVEINKKGIYPQFSFTEYFEDLVFFLESGIIKLSNIVLQKKDGTSFSINQASSGEQSCIISMLAIASKIQDGALICIDEPEICLHPEWQEKYIKLLITAFKSFRACHFLIATHSPQIVSNLNQANSFILDMESAEVTSAKAVIDKSADFQLANLFNSPGHKNEYLIRIALNTFTKVSKNKAFDSEDNENYDILDRQIELLDPNDPVLDLIKAVKDLRFLYA